MMEFCALLMHNKNQGQYQRRLLPGTVKLYVYCSLHAFFKNCQTALERHLGTDRYSYYDIENLRVFPHINIENIKSIRCNIQTDYFDLSPCYRYFRIHSTACRKPYIANHYYEISNNVTELYFSDQKLQRLKEGRAFELFNAEIKKRPDVNDDKCHTNIVIKTFYIFTMKDNTEIDYDFVQEIKFVLD